MKMIDARSVDINYRLVGSGTATWMPNGCTLQKHFFAITKGVTALGAAGASGMKMVVVTGLQDFARDESEAIGALDAE